MNILRGRLGGTWQSINGIVGTASEYISCFGILRGIFFLAARKARLYPSGKTVLATVPGSDIQLLVRLGTPDITVFNEIYYGKEHDWDFEVAPETIMDAGAYTGLSTAYFAVRYPGAKIIAIEPSEDNFALLVRNVSQLENVHAINAALWSEPGSLVLTDPGRDYWGLTVQESDTSTSADQADSLVSSSKVDALTISDLMSDYEVDRVNLLKLDIEGSEKEVFSNARPWIDRVDAISIELHDRFKPGCTRAFFGAVTDFPIELRRGEKILVIRDDSPLGVVIEPLTETGAEPRSVQIARIRGPLRLAPAGHVSVPGGPPTQPVQPSTELVGAQLPPEFWQIQFVPTSPTAPAPASL
jgi:FkbM family methyltransferase